MIRECWSGCGAITECHPVTGYCAPCQKFHEECLESWRRRRQRASVTELNYIGSKRNNRVGIQVGHIEELDFTESEWQDYLHPNEGCR